MQAPAVSVYAAPPPQHQFTQPVQPIDLPPSINIEVDTEPMSREQRMSMIKTLVAELDRSERARVRKLLAAHDSFDEVGVEVTVNMGEAHDRVAADFARRFVANAKKQLVALTLDVELLDDSIQVRCEQSTPAGAAIYAAMSDDLKMLMADGAVKVDNICRILDRHRATIRGQDVVEISIWSGPASDSYLLRVWRPGE